LNLKNSIWVSFVIIISFSIKTYSQVSYYNTPVSSAKYFGGNTIYDIVKDQEDYYWVATSGGLYRFDGYSSIMINDLIPSSSELEKKSVNYLKLDSKNRLWYISPRKGANYIDLNNYTHGKLPLELSNGSTISNFNAMHISEDSRYLWLTVNSILDKQNGLIKINKNNLKTNIIPLPNVNLLGRMHHDIKNDSILWIGGKDLVRFNKINQSIKTWQSSSKLVSINLLGMVQSKQGLLYIRHNNPFEKGRNIILVFDTEKNKWVKNQTLYNSSVLHNGIALIDQNQLLISGSTSPFYKIYDITKNSISKWNLTQEMIKGEGNISIINKNEFAVCGYNLNIIKHKNNTFKFHPICEKNSPFHDNARLGAATLINENLYIPRRGLRNVIAIYNTKNKQKQDLKLSQKQDFVSLFKKDSKSIIGYSRKGIFEITIATGKVTQIFNIKDILKNSSGVKRGNFAKQSETGEIWIATSNEHVISYNPSTQKINLFKLPSYDKKKPRSSTHIAINSKNDVFVTNPIDFFVKQSSDSSFVSFSNKYPNLPSIKDKLPSSIAFVGKKLVFGAADNYQYILNFDNKSIYQIGPRTNRKFTYGIASLKDPYYISTTKDGWLIGNVNNLNYRVFSIHENINIKKVSSIPPIFISDSIVNIGYFHDFATFNLNNIITNDSIKIDFSSIKVNQTPIHLKKINKPIVQLSPNTTSLEISFSTKHLDPFNNIKFRYKLKGVDDDFQLSPLNNSVYFSHLKPGQYIFEIQSTNMYGNWQENTKQFKFEILAPWYKQWWFSNGHCSDNILYHIFLYKL